MRLQELIEKFRKNECTASERAEVLAYFEEHPEAYDQFFNEEEFIGYTPIEHLQPIVSDKLLDNLDREMNRGNTRVLIRRFLAAASIALLVGSGWFLLTRNGQKDNASTLATPAKQLIAQLERKTNPTAGMMTVTTEDGSQIELAPNSSIDYDSAFLRKDQRTVYLSGKARFKVANDPSRPFTVISAEVKTQVLGTSFTVTAIPGQDQIAVALHEGSVRVSLVDSANSHPKYLVPGDEYIFNTRTLAARVVHGSMDKEMALTKAGTRTKSAATVKKPEWYAFNGLALSQVLDQLSDYYQVDIYYYPSELKNKYFSGRLDRTDSLDVILSDIALLNKLIVEKKNGAWYLKRSRP